MFLKCTTVRFIVTINYGKVVRLSHLLFLYLSYSMLRKEQLQSLLRKLKNEGYFGKNVYKSVYPTGSRPIKMYGLPKLHKIFYSVSAFRSKLLSIVAYNYQLP